MAHELAKRLTEEKKVKIKHEWNFKETNDENLKSWDFEIRSKTHPHECPCYTGQPCHKLPLNCLLCFCPEYDLSKEEGGCKRKGDGQWFYHPNLPNKKVWDCSNCDWPHKKDNIKKYLKAILE